MPRTLARCLLSVAVVLAGIASAQAAGANPAKKGDATAHELATQSQTVAKLAPVSKPAGKPHAAKPHAAKPHAASKVKPTAKAAPPAKAKHAKPDQKVKAKVPPPSAKTKPNAKPAKRAAPAKAPAPKPTPLARA